MASCSTCARRGAASVSTPKLDAYGLQDAGLDTYQANLALGYPADARDYKVAAQMLCALRQPAVVLLSNNPGKARQLEELGITVVRRRRTGVHVSPANRRYLATKAATGAHTLDLPPTAVRERAVRRR